MKEKAMKYARDTAYRMFQAGFPYSEAQRMRPYLENAYLAGAKAKKAQKRENV